MPLPQGKLMASAETQANVSTKMERAMQDLALKGERQREERERNEAEAEAAAAQAREDDEVERIRKARLDRMKKEKVEEEANKAKGHGEVTHITQDEFLPTVTGSARCVVHFYHRQFERCEVVDARLKTLAPLHPETRFVRIDAEKAPFFVDKLGIRVLPTLVCFEDGKMIAKKVGYNGDTETETLHDIETSLEQLSIIHEVKFTSPKPTVEKDEEETENVKQTTTIRTSKKKTDDDW